MSRLGCDRVGTFEVFGVDFDLVEFPADLLLFHRDGHIHLVRGYRSTACPSFDSRTVRLIPPAAFFDFERQGLDCTRDAVHLQPVLAPKRFPAAPPFA